MRGARKILVRRSDVAAPKTLQPRQGNASLALRLMETTVRQSIFGVVPNMSMITIDSLMWPSDVQSPKVFSDFEVAFHPDRRAHEIFCVAYATAGDLEKTRQYLGAVEVSGPNARIRLAVARALERAGQKAQAAAFLQEALERSESLSSDEIKEIRDALRRLQ